MSINVLVVYTLDEHGQTKQVAAALAKGAVEADASNHVRMLDATIANFKEDIMWADAIALGSFVDNGLPAPALLSLIDSFDFKSQGLAHKIGASFATGAGAAAGLR